MNANSEIVKKLFDACSKKDFETVRSLTHPGYSLKDPLMELHGADELIEMLKSCPGGSVENLTLITEGDKVVSVFDGLTEGQPKMRMCSVITLADGKVKSEEMFYDTAKIPQDMKNMMLQAKAGQGASHAKH